MSYTVTKLITEAFKIATITPREFEVIEGAQLNDGLGYLNDILAEKTVDSDMIPYVTKYDLTLVSGTDEYFIENLIEIETFTFKEDTVRYGTYNQHRNSFEGSPRALGITSLPFIWNYERELGGGRLRLYFVPDKNYESQIFGIFRLDSVTINQDLEETLDRFYIAYLKFTLAERVCIEYGYDVPPGVLGQNLFYRKAISKKSALLDLTMVKRSTLSRPLTINYAQVNFGKAWTVP